ncbi:hypothetical protein C8J57DRAFT_1359581 [Mycena rebaudengoi]|nr:hypothetical protein C8J57DRAFT_1359581 [Mycena rebaudengoi]
MRTPFSGAREGWKELQSNCKPSRLFREENELVEGNGYFHKSRDKKYHELGCALRTVFYVLISPLILVAKILLPSTGVGYVTGYLKDKATAFQGLLAVGEPEEWTNRELAAPDAVLTRPRETAGNSRWYDVTGSKPHWLLKLKIEEGAELLDGPDFPAQTTPQDSDQVYSNESAEALFEDDERPQKIKIRKASTPMRIVGNSPNDC